MESRAILTLEAFTPKVCTSAQHDLCVDVLIGTHHKYVRTSTCGDLDWTENKRASISYPVATSGRKLSHIEVHMHTSKADDEDLLANPVVMVPYHRRNLVQCIVVPTRLD